jgi:hypothetical protein
LSGDECGGLDVISIISLHTLSGESDMIMALSELGCSGVDLSVFCSVSAISGKSYSTIFRLTMDECLKT